MKTWWLRIWGSLMSGTSSGGGGRDNCFGPEMFLGLLEISLCGGKRFEEMFVHELGRESEPHGEVPSVDGFCTSQDERAEGSAVQELH